MKEKIKVIGKATRRKVDFDCSECGIHNTMWIDKVPTSEPDKLAKKIHIRCFGCGALLAFEPEAQLKKVNNGQLCH